MVEFVQIFNYSHAALDKSEKFPLLGFQHPGGDMVGAELLLESLPSDIFSCRPYCLGIVPPNCGIALKVMGGKWNLIHLITVSDFQLLFHGSQPIISLNGICCLIKAWRSCALKVR